MYADEKVKVYFLLIRNIVMLISFSVFSSSTRGKAFNALDSLARRFYIYRIFFPNGSSEQDNYRIVLRPGCYLQLKNDSGETKPRTFFSIEKQKRNTKSRHLLLYAFILQHVAAS
jgi:hypothetical protein